MTKKRLRLKNLGVGLVILAILVVLFTAGWLINQQRLKLQPVTPQVQIPTAQVTITRQDFVPQTILIKKVSTLKWTNRDNKPHQIASDPHPTHSLLPALGKGKLLPAGSSYTLTFDKAGTFTYHDEENPLKFKGVVIVK